MRITIRQYFLEFSCDPLQCFRQSEADFLKVVETMVSVLPYYSLLEINKLVAKLLDDAFDSKLQEVKEYAKDNSLILVVRRKKSARKSMGKS